MFRHVGIVVNDLDKMLWFYRDFLSLDVMYHKIESGPFLNHLIGTHDQSPEIVKLGKSGSTIVELLFFGKKHQTKKSLTDIGITHFAITVNNIEEIYKNFLDCKLSYINPPRISDDGKAKVFFGLDPEKNYIEFVEII